MSDAIYGKPDYIQFYPTLRCNKSCDFCFNRNMPSCDDISFRDFKKLADKLRKLDIKTIDIIGGEPALHPDITEIIGYSEKKGFDINLSSNGTDPELLSLIMSRFKKTRVGVSINDGQTLAKLKGFLGQCSPVVKMVLTADPDFGLMEKILPSGAGRFYLLYMDVMRPVDIGHSVPFSQYLFTVQRLEQAVSGAVYCSGFIPDTATYPSLSKTRCPAGTTKLGIMPDGSVYPCNLFFGINEFRLGNIFNESFGRIWRHEKLAFFRTFGLNSCPEKKCILHDVCHGGCPAHSLIHFGSPDAPEPRCIGRK